MEFPQAIGTPSCASLILSCALPAWKIVEGLGRPAMQALCGASLRPLGSSSSHQKVPREDHVMNAHSPSRGTRKKKMRFSLLKTLKLHPHKGYL